MKGELFLTFLPTDREWIAVHDVADVDGQPVPDRENLASAPADRRCRRRRPARRESQRVVQHRHRQPQLQRADARAPRVRGQAHRATSSSDRRDRGRSERRRARDAARSREHDGPTIVRGVRAGLLRRVNSCIEAAHRAHSPDALITFKDDERPGATLSTDYGPEDRISVSGCRRMFSEHYERTERTPAGDDRRAKRAYTNYRRFEVTGRIKSDLLL